MVLQPDPEPVLSVVVPTFRRPGMLRDALMSVLGNGVTFATEIIVSDDDPGESGRAVVAEVSDGLHSPYFKLRYVVHAGLRDRRTACGSASGKEDGLFPEVPPPGHPAPNWDFGARHARGRYLFKLDDDDVILPGFLARSVAFLEANPSAACVYTAHVIVDMDTGHREEYLDRAFFGSEEQNGGRGEGTLISGAAYALGVLVNEGGYPINHKTIGVCRRSSAERIGFYALAAEDFANSAALGLTGDIGYIPEVLYEYRMHGSNAMTTDLFRVWRFSSLALTGMEQLDAGLHHPALGPRWLSVLGRCREALPLFYLYRAFRDQSRFAAWELWGKLRAVGALKAESRWKGWCLLIAGTFTPGFIRAAAFEVYRRSIALWGECFAGEG